MTETVREEQAITEKPGFKVDAAIDTQVMTARSFPRNVRKSLEEIQAIVSMDEDIAASCYYTLPPRKGEESKKSITGPSIRLAEICCSFWGNIQAGTRIISNDGRAVVVEGWCWDLEKNLKISCEVTKSIIKANGYQYSASMQATTMAAASAIALRNAIFKVVPQVFVEKAYKLAMDIAVNGVPTDNKDKANFENRRARVFESLAKYNIAQETVFSFFNRANITEITPQDLQEIIGIGTSIKDGYIQPTEAFTSRYYDEDGVVRPTMGTLEDGTTKADKMAEVLK